jgi:hypothetical protein
MDDHTKDSKNPPIYQFLLLVAEIFFGIFFLVNFVI